MKITQTIIQENIHDFRFFYDGTLTICVVEMRNGFKFVGHSACADPAEYDKEIGDSIALANAKQQIWSHMGFMLRDRLACAEVGRS